jgi:CBS domain-containing protein
VVGNRLERDLLAASLSRVLDFAATDRRTFLRSIETSEVMSHDLITVEGSATLREAAALLLRHRIGCLPVVKSDRTLVGLVTESDLLKAALLPASEQDAIASQKKETIMSDWKARIQREIDELRRVRDELKVRMHLAKAEAKDRWNELEHQFHPGSQGHQIAQPARSRCATCGGGKLLVDEIREATAGSEPSGAPMPRPAVPVLSSSGRQAPSPVAAS